MVKIYYNLTKPGIIYGNALPAIAGFLLASKDLVDWKLFLAMLVGLSFVIASGCVFNNYMDRDIDGAMERTKNRALVKGLISPASALIFAGLLLFFGVIILYFHTNNSALFAALLGFFVYVFLYTPLKRKTQFATLIGAVAGATPPVVGYTAALNRFDAGAVILFLILVFWQMPHFYAIAIYRIKDYRTTRIPVLPAIKSVWAAKIQMLLYVIGFIIAASMLTVFGYSGYLYLTVLILLGLSWLWVAIQGFKAANDQRWARKMFLFSLITLTSLCVIIPIDKY
jgi:protoheme IX farnesyltransferase